MTNTNAATENIATALLNLAQEEHRLDQLYEDLKNLSAFIKQDESFLKFLRLSNLDKATKIKDLMQLQNAFMFDKTLNMIALLVESNAIFLLQDILNNCLKSTEEELGIVHMTIYAPFQLQETQLQQIEQAIINKKELLPTNFSKIEYQFQIDEKLIGGIKVTINNEVIDNSYLAKLQQGKASTLNKKEGN